MIPATVLCPEIIFFFFNMKVHYKRSLKEMGLEGIMLSEINQRERDKYHMILLIYGI